MKNLSSQINSVFEILIGKFSLPTPVIWFTPIVVKSIERAWTNIIKIYRAFIAAIIFVEQFNSFTIFLHENQLMLAILGLL